MDLIIEIWRKTPRPNVSAFVEGLFAIAIYFLVADAGGAFGGTVSPLMAALVVFFAFRLPDLIEEAQRHDGGLKPGAPKTTLILAKAAGLVALLHVGNDAVAMAFVAGLGAFTWAAYFLCAQKMTKDDLRRVRIHWVRFSDIAIESVRFVMFWRFVLWAGLGFVALSGDTLAFAGLLMLGLPMAEKLINMIFLLKLWSDEVTNG